MDISRLIVADSAPGAALLSLVLPSAASAETRTTVPGRMSVCEVRLLR